jgi:hypothetical protein
VVGERQKPCDTRRFRLAHAIRAVDDALSLLEPAPADGVEVSALERVRADLAVALRTIQAEGR